MIADELLREAQIHLGRYRRNRRPINPRQVQSTINHINEYLAEFADPLEEVSEEEFKPSGGLGKPAPYTWNDPDLQALWPAHTNDELVSEEVGELELNEEADWADERPRENAGGRVLTFTGNNVEWIPYVRPVVPDNRGGQEVTLTQAHIDAHEATRQETPIFRRTIEDNTASVSRALEERIQELLRLNDARYEADINFLDTLKTMMLGATRWAVSHAVFLKIHDTLKTRWVNELRNSITVEEALKEYLRDKRPWYQRIFTPMPQVESRYQKEIRLRGI